MPRQYKEPEDIRSYGTMIGNFAEAAKSLATTMTKLGVPQEDIRGIIGRGRYNTLEEQGYVIYGPEKTAAARPNMEGLFGAFYYVHKPELQLSQTAPELLGRAGFKLQATLTDGKKVEIPLNRVSFDFIERKNPPYTDALPHQRGKLTVRSDVTIHNGDGSTDTLKAGTILTQGRTWLKDEKGEALFGMADVQGRQVDERAATLMLWGNVTSMGLKKHGENTRKFTTLAVDGIDDDFTAQDHMIAWLASMKKHNGVDLMPDFNRYVAQARESLQKNPALLGSITAAIQLSEAAGSMNHEIGGTSGRHHEEEQHLRRMSVMHSMGKHIAKTAAMLNLDQPALNEQNSQLLQRVTQHIAREDEKARAADAAARMSFDKNSPYSISKELREQAGQNNHAFNAGWLQGKGNYVNFPARWDMERPRLVSKAAELGYSEKDLQSLAADMYQKHARKTVKHDLHALAESLQNIPEQLGRRHLVDPASHGDPGRVFYDAGNALIELQHQIGRNPEGITALGATVEKVRAARQQFEKSFPAPHNKPVRAMLGNIDNFLTMMDAVGHDPKKWMDLYRNTDALFPPAEQQQGFSGRIAAARAAQDDRGHGVA